jgi:small nuclear ribonucleoprotein D3
MSMISVVSNLQCAGFRVSRLSCTLLQQPKPCQGHFSEQRPAPPGAPFTRCKQSSKLASKQGMGEGIPIRLLHEAVPHVVTVETRSGDVFRGTLSSAEDNMNVQLRRVTRTHRDGRVSALEHIFIRGSSVRFVVMPDILSNAPMFKRVQAVKDGNPAESRGLGRGRGYAGAAGSTPGSAAGRGAPRTGGRGAGPPSGRGQSL